MPSSLHYQQFLPTLASLILQAWENWEHTTCKEVRRKRRRERRKEIYPDPKDGSFCYDSSKSWFSPFFSLCPKPSSGHIPTQGLGETTGLQSLHPPKELILKLKPVQQGHLPVQARCPRICWARTSSLSSTKARETVVCSTNALGLEGWRSYL